MRRLLVFETTSSGGNKDNKFDTIKPNFSKYVLH